MRFRTNGGAQWKSLLGWAISLGVTLLIFRTYRWAGTPFPIPSRSGDSLEVPVMRLENADFESQIGNRKSWALKAKSIDFEKQSGAALSNIRKATLNQIIDGKLYEVFEEEKGQPKPKKEEVNSTFSADRGEYEAEDLHALPYDLALLFHSKWRFKLSGNVRLTTQSGATIVAPNLTILELVNNNTHKTEQRILCNDGANIATKQVRIQTNKARLNPADRVIECMEGVRATFDEGEIQTERLFWTVKDGILVCPTPVSGTWRKMPFTATNLSLDLRNKIMRADFIHAKIDLNTVDENEMLPRLKH